TVGGWAPRRPPGTPTNRAERTPMIAPFRNHLPVKIRFGDGVAGDLPAVLADEGASKPFLIMDRGLDGFVPGVAAAIAPLDGAVRCERNAGEPTAGRADHAEPRLHDAGT